VALREAISAGLLSGPRIVAAGPQLTTTGGHAWATGGEVDSVTDIRRAVREHHKAGADVIKVMATGGFMTARTAPWNAQFTTPELRALVEEAHRLGKHTAAHAHGTEGIRRAVEAGIDYLGHASFVDADGRTRFDPDLADEIAERGIYVDTCSPPSWPPVAAETWTPRAYELYQHGVGLVAGHDIGAVLPPSGYTFGLKQLEASGIPRTEVLLAATSRAAAAAGLAGVTGVLAPGYAADLIVTAADPLADLDALDHLLEIVIFGRTFAADPVPEFDPERPSGPAVAGHPHDVRADWLKRTDRRRNHPTALLAPTA
jgi:imidazolonepropionase-like amidohydrolase